MNLLKKDSIKLDDKTIDALGVWGSKLKVNPIPANPPIKEGVVEYLMDNHLIQIYFKNETESYSMRLYVDEKLFTSWRINKMVVSTSTFGIERLPETVDDLNLVTTMTSTWAYALKFIDLYWESPELVAVSQVRTKKLKKGNKQPSFINKSIYKISVPDGLTPIEDSNQVFVDARYKEGVVMEEVAIAPDGPFQEQINNHLDNYYKAWVNESLPALKGKTPIEASKTESGKKELETLFTYMKNLGSAVPFPEDEIRKALNL